MKLAFINTVQAGYRTKLSGEHIFHKVLPYVPTPFVSAELAKILAHILAC